MKNQQWQLGPETLIVSRNKKEGNRGGRLVLDWIISNVRLLDSHLFFLEAGEYAALEAILSSDLHSYFNS